MQQCPLLAGWACASNSYAALIAAENFPDPAGIDALEPYWQEADVLCGGRPITTLPWLYRTSHRRPGKQRADVRPRPHSPPTAPSWSALRWCFTVTGATSALP